MRNELLDLLELIEFAGIVRELRFESTSALELDRFDLRKALTDSGVTTSSLNLALSAVGGIDEVFSAESVTALNVKKGSTTEFINAADAPRYQQAQFNDIDLAKSRLLNMGGTITDAYGTAKSEDQIFEELVSADVDRQSEAQSLLNEIEASTEKAEAQSGVIGVDSSWINTIESNGDGTTSVGTYGSTGRRTYTYPDSSGDAFEAMHKAHAGGRSVGKAWHREIEKAGLAEIFTTG